ncbi:MAG: hypothetical protein AB8B61_09220 [Cyclobacteriaceae bacterium]
MTKIQQILSTKYDKLESLQERSSDLVSAIKSMELRRCLSIDNAEWYNGIGWINESKRFMKRANIQDACIKKLKVLLESNNRKLENSI